MQSIEKKKKKKKKVRGTFYKKPVYTIKVSHHSLWLKFNQLWSKCYLHYQSVSKFFIAI